MNNTHYTCMLDSQIPRLTLRFRFDKPAYLNRALYQFEMDFYPQSQGVQIQVPHFIFIPIITIISIIMKSKRRKCLISHCSSSRGGKACRPQLASDFSPKFHFGFPLVRVCTSWGFH